MSNYPDPDVNKPGACIIKLFTAVIISVFFIVRHTYTSLILACPGRTSKFPKFHGGDLQ